MLETYDSYKQKWSTKTKKQIEKEIDSWRRYMAKNERAYYWHGDNMTPPGSLADGLKLLALREILGEQHDNKVTP